MKLGRRSPDDPKPSDADGTWLRDLPPIPAAPVPRVPRPNRVASEPGQPAVVEKPAARVERSESRRRTTGGRDVIGDMQHRFEQGDFEGALAIADVVLAIDPSADSVRMYAERAEARLSAEYLTRLGGDRAVLAVASTNVDLVAAGADPRAAFVLSLVDGMSTLDDVVHASGLRTVDALRILLNLAKRGVIRRAR